MAKIEPTCKVNYSDDKIPHRLEKIVPISGAITGIHEAFQALPC